MKDTINPWFTHPLDSETSNKLTELFHGERDGYVQIGKDKYFFPSTFGREGRMYYTFEPRSNDVWIVTYPRSGTTLTQELTWMIGNDFDFETAARNPLATRFPFFEFGSCVHPQLKRDLLQNLAGDTEKIIDLELITGNILPTLETSTRQRFIKTHIPLSLLNPELTTCGAKVIYVARNPKDVAVSYYHLSRLFKTLDYTGTFQEFWDLFENDQIMWSPYWKHLNEGWKQRNNPNVLFLFYEDILKDIPQSIRRIAQFIGRNVTQQQIEALTDHMAFQNFQKNTSVNFENIRELGILNHHGQQFIRKGGRTEHQVEWTPQLERKADMWIEKNLQKTTMRFPNK